MQNNSESGPGLTQSVADSRYASITAALALVALALPQGANPVLPTDPGNISRVPVSVQATGTVRYVSNTASNGYVVGSDANNGLTAGAPFLTITAAYNASAVGDTVVVNPTATTYSESGTLNISKNITLMGDPAVTGVRAIVSTTNGTTFVFADNGGATYANLTIDGQSDSGKHGFGVATNLRLVNVWGKNFAAGRAFVNMYNPSVTLTMEKCGLRSADNNAVSATPFQFRSTGCTAILKGCTVTGVTLYEDAIGGGLNSFAYRAASDGTQSTLSPGQDYTFAYTQGSVEFSDCNITCALPFYHLLSTGTQVGDVTVQRCTITQTAANQAGLVLSGTLTGNAWILNNVVTGTGTQSFLSTGGASSISGTLQVSGGTYTDASFSVLGPCGAAVFQSFQAYNSATRTQNFALITSSRIMSLTVNRVTVTGTGFGANHVFVLFAAAVSVTGNVIQTDTTGKMIQVGVDGYTDLVTNIAATTGDQNLGDVSGNKYISQIFTTPASSGYANGFVLGSVMVALKQVGSPTQTITASVYTDNAGTPGAQVATTSFSMNAALLSTSYQWVSFWSETRLALTPATNYHLVLTSSGVNGSNYLQIERNSTGTVLRTSSDGATFTAGTGSVMFKIGTGAFECKSPVVSGNKIQPLGAGLAVNFVHGILIGATDGGIASRNEVYDTRLGVVFKLVDGSVRSAVSTLNIVRTVGLTGSTITNALMNKASKNVYIVNNTVVSNNDSVVVWSNGPDTPTAPDNTRYNATPARYSYIENNVGVYLGALVGVSDGDSFGGAIYNSSSIGCTVDYNVYYMPSAANFGRAQLGTGSAGSPTSYASFAAWKSATGYDTHSVSANPNLVSTSITGYTWSNLKPTAGSNVFNAGVDLGGIVPLDFLGAAQTTPPTAGAFYGT